jgi:hypothetical protein
VRGIVRKWVGESRVVDTVTADGLLARTGDEVGDGRIAECGIDEIHIPVGMLADLHDPRLVITPDYVGPARARLDRHDRRPVHNPTRNPSDCRRAGPMGGRPRRRRPRRPAPTPIGPLMLAVVLTAVTVAPLTLALADWVIH